MITKNDLYGLIDKKAEIKKKNKKKLAIKTSDLLIFLKILFDLLIITSKLKIINIKIPKINEAPKAILLIRRNKNEKPISRIA